MGIARPRREVIENHSQSCEEFIEGFWRNYYIVCSSRLGRDFFEELVAFIVFSFSCWLWGFLYEILKLKYSL